MECVGGKKAVVLLVSAVVLIGMVVCLLTLGSTTIAIGKTASILAYKLLPGWPLPLTATHAETIIIWDIRFQRVALAVIVGSSLAVSGACYQTLFRNPLADPFILGVSSGAALGAALAIVSGTSTYLVLWAFGGALVSMVLVHMLGWRNGFAHPERLLLAGVACGSLLNALLSCVMVIHAQQMNSIIFWLMGSVSNASEHLPEVALVAAAGFLLLLVFARDLDVLSLGDDSARYLGVDAAPIRLLLLVGTTLVTAVVVAVSGVIGFIGLVVPHMARAVVGPGHRLLLVVCALWGAVFLLAADGVTRVYSPLAQIPVGVVTALIGGPFFLYILFRSNQQ